MNKAAFAFTGTAVEATTNRKVLNATRTRDNVPTRGEMTLKRCVRGIGKTAEKERVW